MTDERIIAHLGRIEQAITNLLTRIDERIERMETNIEAIRLEMRAMRDQDHAHASYQLASDRLVQSHEERLARIERRLADPNG